MGRAARCERQRQVVPQRVQNGSKVGGAPKAQVVLKGGHISVVAGAGAVKRLWPKLDTWLQARSA